MWKAHEVKEPMYTVHIMKINVLMRNTIQYKYGSLNASAKMMTYPPMALTNFAFATNIGGIYTCTRYYTLIWKSWPMLLCCMLVNLSHNYDNITSVMPPEQAVAHHLLHCVFYIHTDKRVCECGCKYVHLCVHLNTPIQEILLTTITYIVRGIKFTSCSFLYYSPLFCFSPCNKNMRLRQNCMVKFRKTLHYHAWSLLSWFPFCASSPECTNALA